MPTSPSALNEPPVPYCALLTDDAEVILGYATDGADHEAGAALVTLVEIRGGAARALGAQMAVRGDGGYCGYVSGGCTEAAVAAEAIEAIRIGTDRFLRLGEGSRFFDISLPCGGGITVAIHVIKDAEPLRHILSLLGSRKRIALSYDPGKQSIATISKPQPRGAVWEETAFVRPYKPTLQLVLFGRGIELATTLRVSRACGFKVRAFEDPRNTFRADDIDQDTAIALLFHDLDLELPVLTRALKTAPFYIGALGSRRTHDKRCEALWALGFAKAETDRIKAPIGMFGPARNANTLALSVVADIAAVYSAAL
ncbi:MAG: XdhC family protein [Pararhizobium sp.]